VIDFKTWLDGIDPSYREAIESGDLSRSRHVPFNDLLDMWF
jgi:hypothetical protein